MRIENLSPNEQVLVCVHILEDPAGMNCVYHSDDGTISLMCDQDHDMSNGSDIRWAHASHLAEMFPQLKVLEEDIPAGSMGYYFYDQKVWAVDTLLDT